jgi:DNA-binding transcriptional ArsR family regulator
MKSVSLQEMISRGRFIFSGSPKKFEVFELINGKRTGKDIARRVGRSQSSVLRDLQILRDFGLVIEKKNSDGNIVKKNKSTVFEKTPLIKYIPHSYFEGVADTRVLAKQDLDLRKVKVTPLSKVHIPDKNEILDLCRHGEDQLREFKAPGSSTDKITKEIAAFLHTRHGGLIFYGVEDDGSIVGTDISRQEFDQRIQNSIRNTISPSPKIEVKERDALGSIILLIVVPPWDRETIYQYTKTEILYTKRD